MKQCGKVATHFSLHSRPFVCVQSHHHQQRDETRGLSRNGVVSKLSHLTLFYWFVKNENQSESSLWHSHDAAFRWDPRIQRSLSVFGGEFQRIHKKKRCPEGGPCDLREWDFNESPLNPFDFSAFTLLLLVYYLHPLGLPCLLSVKPIDSLIVFPFHAEDNKRVSDTFRVEITHPGIK